MDDTQYANIITFLRSIDHHLEKLVKLQEKRPQVTIHGTTSAPSERPYISDLGFKTPEES